MNKSKDAGLKLEAMIKLKCRGLVYSNSVLALYFMYCVLKLHENTHSKACFDSVLMMPLISMMVASSLSSIFVSINLILFLLVCPSGFTLWSSIAACCQSSIRWLAGFTFWPGPCPSIHRPGKTGEGKGSFLFVLCLSLHLGFWILLSCSFAQAN